MSVNAFVRDLDKDSKFFNLEVAADETITAAQIASENGKFGICLSTLAGVVNLTLDSASQDGDEVLVTLTEGFLSAFISDSGGGTVGGDVSAEINGLATVMFIKNGTDWKVKPIALISTFEPQPDTGISGVQYAYFTINTSRENGQNADFQITTTTNPAILDVAGVETSGNAFSVPGTGLDQELKVWVPLQQGRIFTSTDAFITQLDSRSIDSGITDIIVTGANQSISDMAVFPSLEKLHVQDTGSLITDAVAQIAPGIKDINVSSTSSSLTDALGQQLIALESLFVSNTASNITDATAVSSPGLLRLYADSTPSIITDATAQSATSIIHINVTNTSSVLTDLTAQSAPGLILLNVSNTPSTLTDLTAQSATSLLILYVTNTLSNLTDLTAQSAPGLTTLFVSNTASILTDLTAQSAIGLTSLNVTSTASVLTSATPLAATSLSNFRAADTLMLAVNVDGILNAFAASPSIAIIHLDGSNQPRTTASDAAFTTLNAALGANLKVN